MIWEERNGIIFEDHLHPFRLIIDSILARLHNWLFMGQRDPSFSSWIFDWECFVL